MSIYTEERWKNWLKQVEQSNFTIEDGRDGLGPEGIVFLNMEEDIILALCKLTGKFQNGSTPAGEAGEILNQMEGWVYSDAGSMDPDKEAMFRSVKTALFAAFGGARAVIDGKANKDDDVIKLLMEADGLENGGKDEEAFESVCLASGAVFYGVRFESDDLLDRISGSLVADWVDGIDTIQAVLAGGVDYSDEADKED